MTKTWLVTYDNHSQNPGTWTDGSDEIDADSVTIREGHLRFTNDTHSDEEDVAGYAPGFWTSYRRRKPE